MTNKKVRIGSIVMAVLLVVSVVGLFLPFSGLLGIDLTAAQFLQWSVQEYSIGGLFALPIVYITVAVLVLIAALVLAVLGIVTGKVVLQNISGLCALAAAVVMLVCKNSYGDVLAGFWVIFAGSLAALLCLLLSKMDLKEVFRKFMVTIKRRPQLIPLCAFVVTFVYYSLNLTDISNTTAKIQATGMGLAGFATMLLSILSLVCCLNAFPYRKKPNIPMVVLLFVMAGIVIFADVYYSNLVVTALNNSPDAAKMLNDTPSIALAYNMLQVHVILLIVSVVLTVLLPVYSKLLRKVKTSVEVEGNGDMKAIDITAE